MLIRKWLGSEIFCSNSAVPIYITINFNIISARWPMSRIWTKEYLGFLLPTPSCPAQTVAAFQQLPQFYNILLRKICASLTIKIQFFQPILQCRARDFYGSFTAYRVLPSLRKRSLAISSIWRTSFGEDNVKLSKGGWPVKSSKSYHVGQYRLGDSDDLQLSWFHSPYSPCSIDLHDNLSGLRIRLQMPELVAVYEETAGYLCAKTIRQSQRSWSHSIRTENVRCMRLAWQYTPAC